MMRRAIMIVAALLAAPAWAVPKVGEPAPPFKVTTLDGQELSLGDMRGKVVILNFWATWCGPCKRELPLLSSYADLRQQNGLRVVAVTTEDSIPVERLKPLGKALSFPLARRFHGSGYGSPAAVPTNYVIDRSGVLRYAKAGAFTLDEMNEVLVPLLNEPPPAAAVP